MQKTTGERASRKRGRASGGGETSEIDSEFIDDATSTIDEDDGADTDLDNDEFSTGELVAAALFGAAVGAGLGLLATRLVDTDDLRTSLAGAGRSVNRGVRRGIRTARERARPDALKGYAGRARRAFEDALEDEVRALRRAARRRRRKLGF